MVDYSIVVCVHSLEQPAHPLYLVAVLPQLMLEGEVLEVGGRQVAFLQLLLLHPPHYHIYHLSLVSADQQNLLTLMQGDQCRLFSFELPSCHADIALGLADGLDEILLQLIPEHLPEGGYLGIILAILLNAVHNAHGPLYCHRLEPVLLIEVGVHVRLKGLHGSVGLEANLIVLGLGGVDLVDEFLQLMEGEVFVEFDVDVWRCVGIGASAFGGRFGLFSLDDVGDGGLKHIVLAVLGDLIQQFRVLGL